MNAKRLEFHITTICNQSCIFCSEYDRMEAHKKFPISFLTIKVILIDKRKNGFDHITFLGGEPTLFPQFEELLEFAKKLGYKVMLITNGLGLQNKTKAFSILDKLDELSLSIHGYNQETLAFQTGNRATYENLLRVFSNIKDYQSSSKKNLYLFSNIVVNRYNFANVVDIFSFIEKNYALKQLLISYPAPEGMALKNYGDITFDYKDFISYIPKIISFGDTKSIKTVFFGFPLCVLGEKNIIHSNDHLFSEKNTIERYTTSENRVTLIDIYSPDPSRERQFVEKCDTCNFKMNPCPGVFNKYVKYYDFR